jgi:uncharacterized membrane protein YuzA (DUF378 family)
MNNNSYYFKTKLNMILCGLVILGAFNWGTTAIGYNLVELLSKYINSLINNNIPFDKIIYMIVAASALCIAIKRDTWLPFLGKTVFPSQLIPLKTPKDTNRVIEVRTLPNSKIAYWAALPRGTNPDVVTAYGDFSNSGVVMSDANGIAKFPIKEGSGYFVPSGRKISRHVHYRVLGLPYGMADKLRTVKY